MEFKSNHGAAMLNGQIISDELTRVFLGILGIPYTFFLFDSQKGLNLTGEAVDSSSAGTKLQIVQKDGKIVGFQRQGTKFFFENDLAAVTERLFPKLQYSQKPGSIITEPINKKDTNIFGDVFRQRYLISQRLDGGFSISFLSERVICTNMCAVYERGTTISFNDNAVRNSTIQSYIERSQKFSLSDYIIKYMTKSNGDFINTSISDLMRLHSFVHSFSKNRMNMDTIVDNVADKIVDIKPSSYSTTFINLPYYRTYQAALADVRDFDLSFQNQIELGKFIKPTSVDKKTSILKIANFQDPQVLNSISGNFE